MHLEVPWKSLQNFCSIYASEALGLFGLVFFFHLFLKVIQRPQPSPEAAQIPRPKHQAQTVLVFPAGDSASQGSSFSSPAPLPLWEGCYLYLGTKLWELRKHLLIPPLLNTVTAELGDSPPVSPPCCTSTVSLQEQLQPFPAPGISLCQPSLASWEIQEIFPHGFSSRGSLRCRYRRKELVLGRRQEQRTIFPSILIFTANLRGGSSDEVLGKGNLFTPCNGY